MDSRGAVSDEVTIRPMRESDVAAVAELAAQLGYERAAEEIRRWIATLADRIAMGAATQAAFVACVGGEVVGWIEVSIQHHLQEPPFALIGGLVVRDGLRGQGVGRQLCEQAERWGRERGVSFVRVTSRSSREAAHRFYFRDGYSHKKTSLVFEKSLADV